MYVAGSMEFESRKSGLYHFIFSLPIGPKFTLFACSVKIDLDFLLPGTMLGFLTTEQWRYCRRKGLCFSGFGVFAQRVPRAWDSLFTAWLLKHLQCPGASPIPIPEPWADSPASSSCRTWQLAAPSG